MNEGTIMSKGVNEWSSEESDDDAVVSLLPWS
jgi:hypothetical protein